jgi:hypothetical protein
MRGSRSGQYLIATAAVGVHAASVVVSLALLARHTSLEVVGRFALCLAIASFAQAADGVRQVAVVMASQNHPAASLRGLAGWSFLIGAIVAIAVFAVSLAGFRLPPADALALAVLAACSISIGAWMGRGEGMHGAHWALAVQGCAAAAATWAAAGAAFAGAHALTPWALLVAPVVAAMMLGATRLVSLPSVRQMAAVRSAVLSNTGSHLVTGLSGVIDRVGVALLAGPALLGLYAPIAEPVARLGGLVAMAVHYFLPAEAALAAAAPGATTRHRRLVGLAIVLVCAGAVGVAVLAEHVAQIPLGRSDPDNATALRILMIALVVSAGASWAAVILKSRMRFTLYPPYLVTLLACALAAPFLIPGSGIEGPALLLLISTSAGMVLIYRAWREIGATIIGCLVAAVSAIGAAAILHVVRSPHG